MHIGVDLDNTIVCYDTVFYETARKYNLIPSHFLPKKSVIKQFVVAHRGNKVWTKLQGEVYGIGMKKAVVAEGCMQFLSFCRQARVQLSIISHRTKYPAQGARVDLRVIARDWLRQHDIVGTYIHEDNLFFVKDRKEKIRTIRSIGCTHFIDDLLDVYSAQPFPKKVKKILYGDVRDARWHTCPTWDTVGKAVFGGAYENLTMKEQVQALLKTRVKSLTRITNTHNSEIFVVKTGKGDYVAKQYRSYTGDMRDRLGVEFYGLTFLWDRGIRSIPKPIRYDRALRLGIYECIDGKRINARSVRKKDIDAIVAFAKTIHEARLDSKATNLPDASEANFSITGYMKNITARLDLLLQSTKGRQRDAAGFLSDNFLPAWNDMTSFVQNACRKNGIDIHKDISKEARTLSSSDFGFHNALRKKDGNIVFIDFEYFGWDDPAKLIADFLLHPAMNLPRAHRRYFFDTIHTLFHDDSQFVARLPLVYRLLAFKWALIMLNPFLRSEQSQRERQTQLGKAKNMIDRIKREHGNNSFPLENYAKTQDYKAR